MPLPFSTQFELVIPPVALLHQEIHSLLQKDAIKPASRAIGFYTSLPGAEKEQEAQATF